MSGRNQKEDCRKEGMSFCLDFLEKHDNDVEALKEECRKRGAYNIPLALNKKDADDFSMKIRENTLDTVLVMSMLVLHDEFDFGTKRLNQFKTRFNEKAECLAGEYTTWDETLCILKDECGLDLNIRWMGGGDPTKKE